MAYRTPPPSGSRTPPQRPRPARHGPLRDERISSTFNLANWLEIPTAVDLPPVGEFPPGWLDERRQTLDEEMRPEKRGEPNHSRLCLVKLRVDLLTKGYVDLPKPYVDHTRPFRVSAHGQTMDITGELDTECFILEANDGLDRFLPEAELFDIDVTVIDWTPVPVPARWHVDMSCDSRSLPQEQLTSDDLHLQAPLMPVINLGHLTLQPETRSRMVEDIAKACHDLGYFQVINHGISQSVMDRAVEAASDFFKLPSETKQEEDMGKFSAEVRRVALQLMEAILEGLGLGKHYQHEEFERGLQLLQVNCYPKEPEGESAIGLAPHSDHGFLTILLASCPGLEVLDRSTNTWRVVQQPRHVLHVHVGDLMEVLSNGRIKTVVHRAVLNPGEARISMASIHSFVMHEKVPVAKELVDEQDPEKYKESSFSDFLDYVTSNVDKKRMSFLDSLRM
ncbi:Hyoscyamine 6-dioxygenase [Hordeum vulgare]|nr:Hyoscyamine 6-dioxygenase [Hordeum vulgare]